MAKKKVVSIEGDFKGILIGLVTQLKDYRLCWHLNRLLGFQLIRENDIEIVLRKKNKTALYSLFRFESELDKLIIYLVSNKYSGEYLIPEVKQADYFLLADGETFEPAKKEWREKLRSLPEIQLLIETDYNKLKSKNNLVFE